MPREPRVQAQAQLGGRSRGRGSAGASPGLVIGIVVLAVSLVAVGALVTIGSLRGDGPGLAQQPAPTPTAPRSTPAVIVVGKQPDAGGTPTAPTAPTEPGSAPAQTNPSGSTSNPLFSPLPPILPSTGSPAAPGANPKPAGGVEQPARTAPASPAGSASPPAAGASTASSSVDAAVATAMSRLATPEDKVGQLLLLAWIGDSAEQARPALAELRAGGIVFVQNTQSSAEAKAINDRLRQFARDANLVEPLITIDHEGGNVLRLKDVTQQAESNWAFAQTGPSDLQACERGLAHAEALKKAGFTMNLAPVLDVNNNPANPVIGRRSYSDKPEVVARLGAAYVRGLQAGGIAAVGKHFPGHGNTSVDSHLGLPSLPQTIQELDRIELVPFRSAIEAGIAGIMSAHIVFPSVDPTGAPATLSRSVMTGLLRGQLGFKGLAVSDDMGAMKAITDNYAPGEAAVKAVQAGVDFLILSSELANQRLAREGLLAAVADGRIAPERLDEAVRNVLTVKAQYGLLGTQLQTGGGCQ